MRCLINSNLVDDETEEVIKKCCCQTTCCEECKNENCHEGCLLFNDDGACYECEFYREV